MSADQEIIEIALKLLSRTLDNLIDACTDAHGDVRAPSKMDILDARKMLPPYCRNALVKK